MANGCVFMLFSSVLLNYTFVSQIGKISWLIMVMVTTRVRWRYSSVLSLLLFLLSSVLLSLRFFMSLLFLPALSPFLFIYLLLFFLSIFIFYLSLQLFLLLPKRSRDGEICIATGYGLDDRRFGVRVPLRPRISLLHVVQTGSRVHPAF
jgi:hypothetical protein